MNKSSLSRRRRQLPASAIALFLLNAYICLPLFTTEIHRHMNSAEGLFIAISRFAMRNWSDLTWLPLWYMGMPFDHVYPPAIHVTAAALATLMHWSAPHAWHFVVAALYSLGPSFLFWAAWQLSGRWGAAFSAGLLWSLFSPSCVLVPSIWEDTGRIVFNRRLHDIVSWGDGPNATTLGIVMLAIGLVHLACTRQKPIHYLGAALALAVVPLSSWPASMALAMALISYTLSRELREWPRVIVHILCFSAFGYAIVAPWIPPSSVWATFVRSQTMSGSPSPAQAAVRGAAALGLAFLIGALWFAFHRLKCPAWLRFAIFYFAITAWITLLADYGGINLITQAARFHLAMEIGFILSLVFATGLLLEGKRRLRQACAILLLLFSIRQTLNARRAARGELQSIPSQSLIEYQTAKWFDENMHGERVWATGSIAFWMNVFTDTPQLIGCCDQAVTNHMDDVAIYELASADSAGTRDPDIRILWLRAFGIHALSVGGPNSREVYKDIHRPSSLINALPVAWRSGDDYICLVPSRSKSLAHVMTALDLPQRSPVNGIDIEPLRSYVGALDDPQYPVVDVRWLNQHMAHVNVNLKPEQIVSFQMTYWPGWRATANGKSIPVYKDNLGLLYLAPGCSGPCAIDMTYDGGREQAILRATRLIALAAGLLGTFWRPRVLRQKTIATSSVHHLS